MVVRIRFGRARKVGRAGRKNQRLALGVAALLAPAAWLAFVLGVWRIAADLNITGTFAISTGVFSHWHAWVGLAALLQCCSYWLNRYGQRAAETAEAKDGLLPRTAQ